MIIRADAMDLLDHVEPGTVQCCVTSPPYLAQRRYGDDDREGGIGQNVIAYTVWLGKVLEQVRQALTPDGLLWLNIGDKANGSGGAGGDWGKGKGVKADGARGPGKFLDPGWPVGSFIDVPGVVVNYLVKVKGWRLRAQVVWDKGVLERASIDHVGRPLVQHEMIYMLAPTGDRPKFRPERMPERGTVWRFQARSSGPAHLAPFPFELARRCIAPSTDPGDLVLDPFSGSGTTVRVAELMGRRGVGLDLYAEDAGSTTSDEVEEPEAQESVARAKAERRTVIGCVHGAHRALVDEMDGDAPSYEWCEEQYQQIRSDAPKPGKALPGWLEEQLRTRWAKAPRCGHGWTSAGVDETCARRAGHEGAHMTANRAAGRSR